MHFHALSALATLAALPLALGSAPPWRDTLLSLHRSLVEIESVTPHEAAVGDFLASYLAGHGFSTHKQHLPNSPRFNVVAWPSAQKASARVMVSSHIDVVPPHIPYDISDPPDKVSPDTRISGRGSVDAKASVAAQVVAVLNLLEAGRLPLDDAGVVLVFVVGEETGGKGMGHFSDSIDELPLSLDLDAAIFGEPTENKLACGHKGILLYTLEAHGAAGHSGYPWLAKSATELLSRALVKIMDADLGSADIGGNEARTTVNVGVLEGGVVSNVIARHASARMAVRVAIGPEDGGGDIVSERITEIAKSVDLDAFTHSTGQSYGFVECECAVDGFESAVMNYGTDVHNLAGDHKRYLYGPGTILVAHGDHENVTVADLEDSVGGFERLILHALKEGARSEL
jgi:acetylornithine deacetylase